MASWWSFGTKPKTEDAPNGGDASTSTKQFKPMNSAFRKGVQYNMKIIIRGDVMTGKTAMFARLQGSPFEPNHETTPQIQVANIPWNYNESNDMVKVEIWDVVDKGINPNAPKVDTGLKLDNKQVSKPVSPTALDPATLTLDATTVNVYRNTHGTILIFDITKPWTFDYVVREFEHVPGNMSVLVFGNFLDLETQRAVPLLAIHKALFQENQRRMRDLGSSRTQLVRYIEGSLLTGYGLKFIHRWFGIPFLELHTETLKQQYESKCAELLDLTADLDTSDEVPKRFKRQRGSANFREPDEERLDRQREEMERTWNDGGAKNTETVFVNGEEDSSSSPRSAASTRAIPPRSPGLLPSPQPLPSDTLVIPRAVTTFDAGSSIEDGFFDDVSGQPTVSIPIPQTHIPIEEDEDWNGGNALVAGDEDVAFEELNETVHNGKGSAKYETKEESDDDYPQPVSTIHNYRSELSSLWGASELPPSHYPITASLYPSAQSVPSDSDDDVDDSYAVRRVSAGIIPSGRSLFDPQDEIIGTFEPLSERGFYASDDGDGFGSRYDTVADPWATDRRRSSTKTSGSGHGFSELSSQWDSISSLPQSPTHIQREQVYSPESTVHKTKSRDGTTEKIKKSKKKEGDEGKKKKSKGKTEGDKVASNDGEKKKKKKKKKEGYEDL